MARLLEVLASSAFEIIIFDTPPLLGISDSSILVSKVDGTVIVIDITRAHKKYLAQLKTILTKTGARVVGCVVNKQRMQRKDSSIYSYYYTTEEPQGANGSFGAGAIHGAPTAQQQPGGAGLSGPLPPQVQPSPAQPQGIVPPLVDGEQQSRPITLSARKSSAEPLVGDEQTMKIPLIEGPGVLSEDKRHG